MKYIEKLSNVENMTFSLADVMSKATKWITFWRLSIILGTIYGSYIGLDDPFDSKRTIGSELLERKKHKYFKQYQILEV